MHSWWLQNRRYHPYCNKQPGWFYNHHLDARSSTYCTDAASYLSPVLHVNADDPEAVVHAINFRFQNAVCTRMYLLIWV
jgi:2-oxoglutarate dehydrogenase complex dehydrogenase (E1) component-like enzyme